MIFKVVKRFGPESDTAWARYLEWSGLNFLTGFDSIDAILRPDLFQPVTSDEWANSVSKDFRLNQITGLPYARQILAKFLEGVIVGVDWNVDMSHQPSLEWQLLGYDVIDLKSGISLLTNWKQSLQESVDAGKALQKNGLLQNISSAVFFSDEVSRKFKDDFHVLNRGICAIYGGDFAAASGKCPHP